MVRPRLDLSNRWDKACLRLWTFNLWRQGTVLDLYAGEEVLSGLYAPRCDRLVCVEKDEEAFRKLEENMSGFHNVSLVNGDNAGFLEGLDECDVSFVDFDAYGCPNELMQLFFERCAVDHAIVVNVTDGGFFNLRRMGNLDLGRLYLVGVPREAWGVKRGMARLMPVLQEQFVHVLAMRHGFSTHFLYHAMNREASVTYYGFIAYPDVKTGLWATGKTSLIRYRKDDGESTVKTLMKLIRREEEEKEEEEEKMGEDGVGLGGEVG